MFAFFRLLLQFSRSFAHSIYVRNCVQCVHQSINECASIFAKPHYFFGFVLVGFVCELCDCTLLLAILFSFAIFCCCCCCWCRAPSLHRSIGERITVGLLYLLVQYSFWLRTPMAQWRLHTHRQTYTHTIIIIIDILTILSTIPNPCSFANWVFNSIFSPFHFSHSLPFFGFRCKCFARCVTPHHSNIAIRQSFWTFPMIYKLRSFVIVGDVGMHEIERQRARHMKIIW